MVPVRYFINQLMGDMGNSIPAGLTVQNPIKSRLGRPGRPGQLQKPAWMEDQTSGRWVWRQACWPWVTVAGHGNPVTGDRVVNSDTSRLHLFHLADNMDFQM